MTSHHYTTTSVCAKEIDFEIEDGRLHNVRFKGGCPGNTVAVAKLVEGQKAEDISALLRGNDCGGKGTSCADQLAKAIDQALNQKIA